MNENSSLPVIRITKEEATSTAVDDLLKRQMSMRGEPGVTRDRRRSWYYQNWVVFMVAGALGAAVAWGCIEPIFDDLLYLQGPVTSWAPGDSFSGEVLVGRRVVEIRGTDGSLRIKGEKVYVVENTRALSPGGDISALDLDGIKQGDEMGVYVEYFPGPRQDIAIASFVVRNPPPQSESRSKMTLSQLQARSHAGGLLLFPLVAGMIGLFIGAADGLVCRLPRRALLCGGVGLVVGLTGGFLCSIVANLVYSPLHDLAASQMNKEGVFGAFGFFFQTMARAIAWCLAGLAMGLGQGLALRSPRLLLYGLIGGLIGGLFGGMLFDPIDLILLGGHKPSAHWSRLIGFMVIGAGVGAMIGIVERLARDAWLRMTQGPLTGKEFLIFKDVMTIGSSPRSDLYIFNDSRVAKQHAIIRAIGDECELEAQDVAAPVLVNNRPITRVRLRHGDNVTAGQTSFVYQRRKG